MKMNYSGCIGGPKKDIIVECKEIETNLKINEEEEKIENDNIDIIMKLYEKTRKENPELFSDIMYFNNILFTKLSQAKTSRDEITEIENIWEYIESINEDFLYWPIHKTFKNSILLRNIDLVHFFIVRKRISLQDKMYEGILCEYMRSLKDINFIESEDEEINKIVQIFQILIDYADVNVNQQEKNTGHSPLHLAVIFKQYQFIILLLKKGCDLSIKNTYEETALDLAQESIKMDEDVAIYEEIVDLLITFGAE
jgi:ankyrin repeat protein